jgi:hypothetical protein
LSGDEGEPVTTKSHPKPTALSRKNMTATAAKRSQNLKKVKGDVLGSYKIKCKISVTSSDDDDVLAVSILMKYNTNINQTA